MSERSHPLCDALYPIGALLFVLLLPHPSAAFLSLVGAALSLPAEASGSGRGRLLLPCLFFLLTMLAVPLFGRMGDTVLFFVNGHPITAEASLYGFVTALRLCAAALWSLYLSRRMTADKWMALLGFLPRIALFFSLTLRFVPLLQKQAQNIARARRVTGLCAAPNGTEGALRGAVRSLRERFFVFSALMTFALEHGVEMSDAMRARGYGAARRTRCVPVRFRRSDAPLFASILLPAALTLCFFARGAFAFVYYPRLSGAFTTETALGCAVFGLYCFLGLIWKGRERLRWVSRSAI